MTLGLIIGFIIGYLSYFMRPWGFESNELDTDCPAEVLGYECKNTDCDHRKSELYHAKATMADIAEKHSDERLI